jgi:sigma-B regulation protein RsbU (phosphoserine phosphatase)
LRTLVIDDSEDARELTEATLHSAGFKDILTASSGWDALRILNIGGKKGPRTDIDMLLLDVVMPEMDGIELCARIRNDERYTDLPIIMVTSLDDVASLSNALTAGANYFVEKPLDRDELVAHMHAAMRLKGELDRRREREIDLLHFMSSWSERRATVWMDEPTGLFVGEVAEAYIASVGPQSIGISVLAIVVDGLEAQRDAHGPEATTRVLARVAGVVRQSSATLGTIAAAYPNGTIVVVAPELDGDSARHLAECLHAGIGGLRSAEGGIRTTASVAVVSGRVTKGVDRSQLLTTAMSHAQELTETGGDRVAVLEL